MKPDKSECLKMAKELAVKHGRYAVPAWWDVAAEYFAEYYALAYEMGEKAAAESAESAASAESASTCRCVLAQCSDDAPVCNGPYFNPSGRNTFCLNRLIEGEYDSDCGHDRDCHPASQSNTGEQK